MVQLRYLRFAVFGIVLGIIGCQETTEQRELQLEACQSPCGFRDSLGFYTACDYDSTRKGFVEVANERIWVEVQGQGEPLVLVNAGPLFDHRLFHPHLSGLTDEYKLIYLDMPGRYMSAYQEGHEYGMAKDLEVLEGLRKRAGYDQWSMLGHSYGGMIGLTYAREYPEKLKELFVVALGLNVDSAQKDSIRKHIKTKYFQDVEGPEDVLKQQKQVAFHQDPDQYQFRYLDSAFYAYGRYVNFSKLSRDYMANTDSFQNTKDYEADSDAFYQGVTVQTTVIAGKEDLQGFPEQTRKAAQTMPNGQFELFEESGHFPHIEQPDKFEQVVESGRSPSDIN